MKIIEYIGQDDKLEVLLIQQITNCKKDRREKTSAKNDAELLEKQLQDKLNLETRMNRKVKKVGKIDMARS